MARHKSHGSMVWRGVIGALVAGFAWTASAIGEDRQVGVDLARMEGEAQQVLPGISQITRDSDGTLTYLAGRLGHLGEGSLESAAVEFVTSLPPKVLGFEVELRAQDVVRDELGVHIRLEQTYAGIPILGAGVLVHANEKTREVGSLNGRLVPTAGLSTEPTLDASVAVNGALIAAGIASPVEVEKPELVYIEDEKGEIRLAWDVVVRGAGMYEPRGERYFVDAATGAVVARYPLADGALGRQVYDNAWLGDSNIPGTLVLSEGGTTSDPLVRKAYDNAALAYNYFNSVHGRRGWDGSDGKVKLIVHYSVPECRGAWFVSPYLEFCDNTTTQAPFGNSADFVTHEYTHGINSTTARLGSSNNEAGALNEGMSDIFAAARQAAASGVSGATWLIGDDTGPYGAAERDLSNPRSRTTWSGESHVDYYPERVNVKHRDMTIGGLAFFLMSEGGWHLRGKTNTLVPPLTVTKAAKVFYQSLTACLGSTSTFLTARLCTVQKASALYGARGGGIAHAAWDAVGVPNQAGQGFEVEPNNTLGSANYMSTGVTRYGRIASSTDTDWFSFSDPSDSDFLVSLTPPAGADFDLELYRGTALVAASRNAGVGVGESIEWLADGRTGIYYVKVLWRSGTSLADFYSIYATLYPMP